MCFSPSAPTDNSGAIAQQQEAQNQATIAKDTGEVNDTFSNEFTPDYYNNITNSYENYYNPQLDQQYQNTLNSLTGQLGQQGILQSTEGQRQLALLDQAYQTQKQTVASNAANAAQQQKQNVAQQQNTLLAQATAAADPTSLATQAANTASSLASPVNYSPLGSVFSGLLGQGTNALSIQQGGLPSTTTSGSGGFSPNYVYGGASGSSGSSGSSNIVP